MSEQQSNQFDTLRTGTAETSVDVDETGALTVLKRQLDHWQSWLAALLLFATAGVLYYIGGWTIDTATFVVGALLVTGYRLWAIQYDFE